MTLQIFGLPIHEFDVAATDVLLCLETGFFARVLFGHKFAAPVPRRLFTAFFVFVSLSSLLGAFFHAFFPRKASTPEGFVVWILTALSVGVAASVVWYINVYLIKGEQVVRAARLATALFMLVYAYVLLFIDYRFMVVILFYLPPVIVLALISLFQAIRTRQPPWPLLLAGVILTFVAAGVQFLHLGIHPHYFNHNALYHLIQGVALALIFISFRRLLIERF